ncbi:MAG: UDP-N-acetylmuramate--L-alanine ligase [Anaerolineae bacterium]|nr:UDP-N-acetylmuramate--L-alanine ligase [Anaerolineae bacterium]
MPNIHLIGIGGAGLSAIATVLLQQGYTVSGSDMQASEATARLTQLGATIFIGHRPENLADNLDTVIVSSAIPPHNPELAAARERGLKMVKRAEWLGRMMRDKVGLAIAGTHGKTTTTGMAAFLFREMGREPTYIVGGFIPQLETNAAAGQGDVFIIEADEYDHMFLGLRPIVAVITTVEWDHPDIFPTRQSLRKAFADFGQLVPPHGLVIGCGDDPGARETLKAALAKTTTYGLGEENDWWAVNVQSNRRGGYDFQVIHAPTGGSPLAAVSLTVPGLHNVYNALAVLAMARQQGLDVAQAAGILGRFAGVSRRFELKGEANGITVIDDYAHHPTEIRATLAAARARFGDRPLWAVFQPHTFSRTMALLNDFAGAFDNADHVIIVDIFASRETDAGLVNSKDILNRMNHPDARYLGPLLEATDYLVSHLAPPAVLLTLGAGDGYQVGEWVLERLNVKRSMSGERNNQ